MPQNGAMGIPSEGHERVVVRHEPVRRSVTVAAKRPVTASLTRVTLAGTELDGFRSLGPDDHIKVVVPGNSGAARDYTPLQFRPGDQLRPPELDVDFVLHADAGPVSAWAAAVAPGDPVTIAGPRSSKLVPLGYPRLVLIADESALPALSRWLDQVDSSVTVAAVIMSDDPEIASYLPSINSGTTLLTVLPTADAIAATLPELALDRDSYLWAAGEAGSLIPVRRYVRRLGLPRKQWLVRGYWKRGDAHFDHHASVDPEDPDPTG